jgi:hypothetical protein
MKLFKKYSENKKAGFAGFKAWVFLYGEKPSGRLF